MQRQPSRDVPLLFPLKCFKSFNVKILPSTHVLSFYNDSVMYPEHFLSSILIDRFFFSFFVVVDYKVLRY